KGFDIDIPADVLPDVYVAGAKLKENKLITSGGRVLGVTAVADTLKQAVKDAYEKVDQIYFKNMYFRHDIGEKALKILEK
ncbi:MAG: hypothetical protein IKR78_00145, partial [Dehalococcoidales bacterium]|nr:hypothetical protein [Dehalococcoidales bacterium]